MEIVTIDTDQVLTQIRSGKIGRDTAIARMYKDAKLRRDVKNLIYRQGGEEADFQSVFNNTLLQFVKTVVKRHELTIDGPLNGYLIGIAKFLWYKEANAKGKHRTIDINDTPEAIDPIEPEGLVLKSEQFHLLGELLSLMGEKCKEVLMHWAHGYRMIKIAEMMSYSSEDMAKKKKYQCMKKMLEYVSKNPHVKEALR